MLCQDFKILIVIVRAGPKSYCWDFYPRFVNKIDYPNKKVLLVEEKNCKALRGDNLGETICANGRQCGIEYARRHNFDYVFFLDLDLEPDPGLLNALLSLEYPLVGALIAARGNAFQIIGHNYTDPSCTERIPLYYPDLKDGDMVDGTSGAALLVHKTIFSIIDFTGYTGPDSRAGLYTADDEWLQLKIRVRLGIRPKIIKSAGGWHYNSDGYKYRLLGEKKRWE